MKQRILIVFGTRPELIKVAPLYRSLKASPRFEPLMCATGQHKELLAQATAVFGIKPDYELHIMKENQDLFDITSRALVEMRGILEKAKPNLVIVQGDTTTAFTAALAAFYCKIPIAHVEAGLRTYLSYSPFPEEGNRALISKIAQFHFAPTEMAMKNLAREGVDTNRVYLVGNTGIDALYQVASRAKEPDFYKSIAGKPNILLTMHRRENFGKPIEDVFESIRRFCEKHPTFNILYPMHPNPNVQNTAKKVLGNIPAVKLLPPLQFDELVYVLKHCAFVMTDSGGIQEEATAFARPVLILRETTERQEAVDVGCAKLVGTDPKLILRWMEHLSNPHSMEYMRMSSAKNPFGDGTASEKITKIFEQHLERNQQMAA